MSAQNHEDLLHGWSENCYPHAFQSQIKVYWLFLCWYGIKYRSRLGDDCTTYYLCPEQFTCAYVKVTSLPKSGTTSSVRDLPSWGSLVLADWALQLWSSLCFIKLTCGRTLLALQILGWVLESQNYLLGFLMGITENLLTPILREWNLQYAVFQEYLPLLSSKSSEKWICTFSNLGNPKTDLF